MIDESKAKVFQEAFYNGEPKALTMMYSECRYLAKPIALGILKAKHIYFEPEKIDSLCHETATAIVERYLKKRDYHIRSFKTKLTSILQDLIFRSNGRGGRPTTEILNTMQSIDAIPEPSKYEELPHECQDYITDLMEATGKAPVILTYIIKSKTFKAAVKSIIGIESNEWLERHVVVIKRIWEHSHA